MLGTQCEVATNSSSKAVAEDSSDAKDGTVSESCKSVMRSKPDASRGLLVLVCWLLELHYHGLTVWEEMS